MQTILAARIDRLPPEEKQLLQAASVIGKDFPYTLLAAIAEQPEETLRRGPPHLQEVEFVYETQLFPDLEHTFKHALTHEMTHGSLLQERRRRLKRLKTISSHSASKRVCSRTGAVELMTVAHIFNGEHPCLGSKQQCRVVGRIGLRSQEERRGVVPRVVTDVDRRLQCIRRSRAAWRSGELEERETSDYQVPSSSPVKSRS